MRTIDEIKAAMNALIAAAHGRLMTAAEVSQYEALETELQQTQSTALVNARHAARGAVQVPDMLAGPVDANNDSPELARAFNHFLRTGRPNQDIAGLKFTGSFAGMMPVNAQSEGVGSEGGFTVPTSMRQKITERMKAFGGVSNEAELLETEGGGNIEWPTIDDTSNTGSVVAENATTTSGADLVFGFKVLGAHIFMANGTGGTPLRLPLTLVQDSAFDIEGKVSDWLGMRIARGQAAKWVTGNGAAEPLGIQFGLTGLAGSTNGPTYDNLIDAIHGVDPAYRQGGNCRWAFNDNTLARIEKLKDSNNNPIWRPIANNQAEAMGNPPSGGFLLGYPVTIDQAFSNFVSGGGTGTNWGVFGDIREGYIIRRVRDIQIIVNPWSRAANLQIEYTAWARADGTQQNTNAYTALAGSA